MFFYSSLMKQDRLEPCTKSYPFSPYPVRSWFAARDHAVNSLLKNCRRYNFMFRRFIVSWLNEHIEEVNPYSGFKSRMCDRFMLAVIWGHYQQRYCTVPLWQQSLPQSLKLPSLRIEPKALDVFLSEKGRKKYLSCGLHISLYRCW